MPLWLHEMKRSHLLFWQITSCCADIVNKIIDKSTEMCKDAKLIIEFFEVIHPHWVSSFTINSHIENGIVVLSSMNMHKLCQNQHMNDAENGNVQMFCDVSHHNICLTAFFAFLWCLTSSFFSLFLETFKTCKKKQVARCVLISMWIFINLLQVVTLKKPSSLETSWHKFRSWNFGST